MAQLDAANSMPGKLNAATTSKQQFQSLTIYFGIELAWHRVGLASSRRHRSVPDPSKAYLNHVPSVARK